MEKRTQRVIEEVKKAIVGKEDTIKKVFMVMLSGGHILLEDVPGVGKTTLSLAFSKAMDLKYKRVQFTSDTMASDIVGYSIYQKSSESFAFQEGAVFTNLFLGDEINRTSPKTQAALLEAMEERKVTVDGTTYPLPDPFICIATQNPYGSAGTQKLPDSQLDRFMVKMSVGYPGIEEQIEIVNQRQGHNPLDDIRQVLTIPELEEMKREVSAVRADREVVRYAAMLCEATRSCEQIDQGVSPRAVLALVAMAKAKAFVEERDYLIPKDVEDLFLDVCAHRILPTAKARVAHIAEEDILRELAEQVQPPKIVKG